MLGLHIAYKDEQLAAIDAQDIRCPTDGQIEFVRKLPRGKLADYFEQCTMLAGSFQSMDPGTSVAPCKVTTRPL